MFSAPALQRILDRRERESLRSVPFFDGLLAGEIDALLGSFAGVPEVHHPVRGRIKGERAFRQFVTEMTAWFAARTAEVEDVNVILTPSRGIEEVVLHLDPERDGRRIGLPLSLAADHDDDGSDREIRLYFSTWPLTGRSRQPASAAPGRRRPGPAGRRRRLPTRTRGRRRRCRPGVLHGDRRRPGLRGGVQRRPLGRHGAAAAGRAGRLRPPRHRAASGARAPTTTSTRRSTRRRSAADLTRAG